MKNPRYSRWVRAGIFRPEPSYEGAEPSRAGALQYSSWNWAMYVKKLQIFTPTWELQSNFPILGLYHDFNQFQDHFYELMYL